MSLPISAAHIRQKFLDFFKDKGHTVVTSSPLVPINDPSLMFTNSGMVQFKDVFLGKDKRPYTRAVSVQTCLRAGGKHNDLENVGYTARHHTFFEMLGNWSFGDYFKRESITWSWELLTQVYGLPPHKLLVTVYHEDDEAYDIWKNTIGLDPKRIIRIGDNKGKRFASDNFWMMANTGPCGPSSEIFYDHGPSITGGPPGSPDEDGDRFIEIWNLVFMQFNMLQDGRLEKLPKPCVDTGMGLERITAVLQGVHSNYEIDLFKSLIKAAAQETETQDLKAPSLKVIADHIRACAFLITDGVFPGNDGRAYVQRRIIRRAVRHGYKLGQRRPFLYKLVPSLVELMGQAYPQLKQNKALISDTLFQEETRFLETLAYGIQTLEDTLQTGAKILPGQVAFTLHDTYGFPLDLTQDICRERHIKVDVEGFEKAMAEQKERARANAQFSYHHKTLDYQGVDTTFVGYKKLVVETTITGLYDQQQQVVETLEAGQSGTVVLKDTPFYGESGGQVGDIGRIESQGTIFKVEDTQKVSDTLYLHIGTVLEGQLAVNDSIVAKVNQEFRIATTRNHSVTHLMHKALHTILGQQVQQKGSLVDHERTRFDFSYPTPVTQKQLQEVEKLVNAEILNNKITQARLMPMQQARETGALMLFGEKYGEKVRVLNIGNSIELCGGTHVQQTGDIGLFKITHETGIAAGIRRIEAVTGLTALTYIQRAENYLQQTAQSLQTTPSQLLEKVDQQKDQIKIQEKTIHKLQYRLSEIEVKALLKKQQNFDDYTLLVSIVEGVETKVLSSMVSQLQNRIKKGIIVLATGQPGKVQIVASVADTMTSTLPANTLVNYLAKPLGGKGGGKANFAMAGASNWEQMPNILSKFAQHIKTHGLKLPEKEIC
jgi:alanyl-tRNA synthetase